MNMKMKITLALAGICVLFCAAEAAPNEVKNPDFEDTADGTAKHWTLNGCYSAARGYGENGSGGLKYENSDPSRFELPRQSLKLKSGREYRFACRTKVEKLEVHGASGGARICIEFTDADGKWCGGSYWGGSGKRTTDGNWITLEKTCRVPEKAVYSHVKPYVDRGVTGVAYFDAVTVEELEVKPVSGLYVSAYRGTAAEGPFEAVAALELQAAGLKSEDVRGEFSFVDAKGATRTVAPTLLTDDEARATVRVEDFPAGASEIAFRLVDRKTGRPVADGTATAEFHRTEKAIPRKVYVDRHRRVVKDGQPFFPIGVYVCQKTMDEAELSTFDGSGINTVINYHPPTPEAMTMFLNHGIYSFYAMLNTHVGRGYTTEASAEAAVRRMVAKVKDHPGLLGWYVNDELNVEWLDRLKRRQKLYEEIDPDHPTWSVIYQLGDMRKHVGTCDIMGSDPYPVCASDNWKIRQAGDWARQTVAKQFGIRGCVQVPQGFDWGDYWPKKRASTRMPTRDEMVNMGLQSIAGGANGLVYYSYGSIRHMTNDTFKTQFAAAWKDLKDAIRTVKRYERIYLLDPGPAATSDDPDVFVRSWKDGDRLQVLAVNASSAEKTAEICVQGAGRRKVSFAPLGYQMTELGDKP